MDCRSYKDYLDSYLSQELAVETNHEMLRHAEHCPECRCEMASRRRLRETLREVCSKEKLSDDACERLRAVLREEANCAKKPAVAGKGLKSVFAGLFPARFSMPIAVAASLFVVAAAGIGIYLVNLESEKIFLSQSLVEQSFGDHRTCAARFITMSGPMTMPETAKNVDAAYSGLEKVAEAGAEGLQLRSAHVCGFGGRRFAHLVYLRDSRLISLLVTARDGKALKTGSVPVDDGRGSRLQKSLKDNVSLGAYQTEKRIVLVVSDLSDAENALIAERLAKPVADHLRKIEGSSTSIDSDLRPRLRNDAKNITLLSRSK